MLRPPAARTALFFGSSYGWQSYCRACYDFTRRYHPGECASCARVVAVKKGHCRLCWLQAGLAATGRRITPADFALAGRYHQRYLSSNKPVRVLRARRDGRVLPGGRGTR